MSEGKYRWFEESDLARIKSINITSRPSGKAAGIANQNAIECSFELYTEAYEAAGSNPEGAFNRMVRYLWDNYLVGRGFVIYEYPQE